MALSEFWLSEEQFARLRPLLPSKVRGVARVDDRRVISGIMHVLKSICRWVDAPACYGPRKTLYNRIVRSLARYLLDTGGNGRPSGRGADRQHAHESAPLRRWG